MTKIDLNFPVSNLVKNQRLSFIAALNQKASLLINQGKPVVKLSAGDPSHYPEELLVLMEEMSHSSDLSIFNYSPIAGFNQLRDLLASLLSRRYRQAYNQDNMLVCSGGCSGLFLTFKTLINSGDKVLIQDPCWEYLPKIIENCGGAPVKMHFFSQTSIQINWSDLIIEIEQQIKSGIKVVSINSPLNPTGIIVPTQIKNEIIRLCKKHHVWFVSDDVTIDFNYLETKLELINNSDYFISVNSFSKNLGITGFRFGFIAAHEKLIEQIKKSQLYTCMYPNSLSQKLIERYLSCGIDHYYEGIKKTVLLYKDNAKNYTEVFSNISGLEVYQPDGGLFLCPKVKQGYEINYNELLVKHYIAVAPGEAFGTEFRNNFRVFIGVDKTSIDKACKAIQDHLTFAYSESKEGLV